MSAVVRASITVTPGIPIIAANILSRSVSTTGGYVRAFIPPWNPKRPLWDAFCSRLRLVQSHLAGALP